LLKSIAGVGNVLAWTIRLETGPIERFYQQKQARNNGIIALKAGAHKLARAAYYVRRDRAPFKISG
jgi:hypothetical protein